MATRVRTKTVAAHAVPDDLDSSVREGVRAAPGSSAAQLVKKLPASFSAFSKQVRDAAERLSKAGEIHRHLKGKTALYFPAEPLAALDAAIPPRLAGQALDKAELRQLAEEVTPGHAVVLDEWLKRALAQRLLYEHAPAPGGAKKRFGAEPDVRKLAAPLLKALQKARDSADANGIPRERLAEILLQELGVSLGDAAQGTPGKASHNAPNGHTRSQFLAALTELVAQNPRQALLSVRDLRARLGLGKDQFDALALVLMRDGAISLHQHDHPMSLPEWERQQLVDNARGTYYVGIAPRSGQ